MSFLEKYKSKNAPAKAAPKRMSKSVEWFAPITVSRAEKLGELGSRACWMLFTILFFESIKSRGKPFALPGDAAGSSKGLSQSNLYRALHQLEAVGLISVRRPSKLLLITVL